MSLLGHIDVRSMRGRRVLVGASLAIVMVLCASAQAFATVSWRLTSISNTTAQPGGLFTAEP